MVELLKSKNLSVTKLRVEVLDIFKKSTTALSTQQIENELKKVDRVSLYRTLKTFKEKGIIHEIPMPDEVTKMAMCPDQCEEHNHLHKHIHFHCDKCKEVFCVDIDKMPTISLEGFVSKNIDIQVSGLCKICA